jgi:hypothetical protein
VKDLCEYLRKWCGVGATYFPLGKALGQRIFITYNICLEGDMQKSLHLKSDPYWFQRQFTSVIPHSLDPVKSATWHFNLPPVLGIRDILGMELDADADPRIRTSV